MHKDAGAEPGRAVSRRSFLAGAAGAAAALTLASGCESVMGLGGDDPSEGFEMHGPVRTDLAYLKLPAAPEAEALFAPHALGEAFERRWAIAHLARGRMDQLFVVLVDLDTGGHAELQVFAAGLGPRPVAETQRYAIFLDNGGHGDKQTPPHMRRLIERLAEIIADNEARVTLPWQLPTFRPSTGPDDYPPALGDGPPSR